MTNWGKFANVNAAQINEGIKALGDGEYPEMVAMKSPSTRWY